MTVTLKEFTGGAAATTLGAGITSGTTALTVAAGSTYPTGSTGPFVIVIGRGTASEERILCSSRTGNSITASTRGYDGTTAASHSTGDVVEHVLDAVTITEANKAAVQTIGKATAANQLLRSTASETFAALDVAASRIVGRKSSGDIDDLTAAEVKTILALVPADITGNPTTATFYTEHTWAISDPAVESGDTDFIIPMAVKVVAGETKWLSSVRYKINSGTSVSFDITKNGTGATGFTTLSATTTIAETDPADVALADGDLIKPDISAVAGTPRNWMVTAVIKHVVTLG